MSAPSTPSLDLILLFSIFRNGLDRNNSQKGAKANQTFAQTGKKEPSCSNQRD